MNRSTQASIRPEEVDRIIEMAWEDRTPFDAIEWQFGLSEGEVIELMRKQLKRSSWKKWRERVHNRQTKHLKKRNFSMGRMHCATQKDISLNRFK